MAKRRDLEIAILAVLTASLPGCAGKSIMPAWFGGKSTNTTSNQSLDDLSAQNAAKNSGSTSGTIGSGLANAFTIKPKVTKASDPTSLDGKPAKLGPEIYVSAARMRESRGDMNGATEQYKKAIEVAPKDTSALVGLARLHDRQSQFAEAEKLYKKAAEVEPKNPIIHNDLGLCYARQKRLEESAATLNKAVQLSPQNAMYRNNLATVLVEAGHLEEAWSQLAALNTPSVAHYNLGYLLHQRQQDALAVKHLQLALATDADFAEAEDLLYQIQGDSAAPPAVYVGTPRAPVSRPQANYSVSDQYSLGRQPAGNQGTYVANATEIVNPLAPANRQSATYRMPPVAEQANDPAPQPSRLPEPMYEQTGPEINMDIPAMPAAKYPTRRTSSEDDTLQQPKNVIRLLGTEPLSAPIPTEE